MRKFEKIIEVPIYNVRVLVIVCDEISSIYGEYENLFGKLTFSNFEGLCTCGVRGLFGIFFNKSALSHEVISHEIHHLTNKILIYHNIPRDGFHDEHSALLNGYLTKVIYKAVGKFLQK